MIAKTTLSSELTTLSSELEDSSFLSIDSLLSITGSSSIPKNLNTIHFGDRKYIFKIINTRPTDIIIPIGQKKGPKEIKILIQIEKSRLENSLESKNRFCDFLGWGIIQSSSYFIIISDGGIDLYTMRCGGLIFPENNIKQILKQLAEALAYIHDNLSIAHLDLKPTNITLNVPFNKTNFRRDYLSNDGQVDIKLIDFGESEDFGTKISNSRGTEPFMAPKIDPNFFFRDPEYSIICSQFQDIWSFGTIILWFVNNLFENRKIPKKSSNDDIQLVINREIEDIISESRSSTIITVNDKFINLLKKLFVWPPENRKPMNQIVFDEWLNK